MTFGPTLKDHLEHSRAEVSTEEYVASRSLHPGNGSSWALWGDDTRDLSIFNSPDAVVPRLRKDVVLLGANFGNAGDGSKPVGPFQNFHCSGNDTKFRNGVVGTALEGAFLTDLVKDYPTLYATHLAKDIKSGVIDVERHVIDGFQAEQDALGLGSDTLYIPMGGKTRELWDLLVTLGAIPADQRVFHKEYGNGPGKRVLNLTHFSAAVNMKQAVAELLAQTSLK